MVTSPAPPPRVKTTTERPRVEPISDTAQARLVRYLTREEYPLWDALVAASPQGSLFCYSWWLDAISPDIRILGCFEKGRLVAGIPLYMHRRFGITLCTMPKLVQTWGVILEPPGSKPVNAFNREMQLLRAMAEQLSKLPSFFQAFHPSLQNWLPFRWNGFRQTSRVTYVLDELDDLPSLWKGLSHSIRGQILKAQRVGLKVVPCDPQEVFEAREDSYQRQGRACPCSAEYLQRLYDAAKARGAGECFAARDRDGRTHAANMLVWDDRRAYFVAGGADTKLRASGASSLIVWELIQFSAERTRIFDFEGSSVESIAKFFRAFGAKQVLYSWITKLPFWMHAFMELSGRL